MFPMTGKALMELDSHVKLTRAVMTADAESLTLAIQPKRGQIPMPSVWAKLLLEHGVVVNLGTWTLALPMKIVQEVSDTSHFSSHYQNRNSPHIYSALLRRTWEK